MRLARGFEANEDDTIWFYWGRPLKLLDVLAEVPFSRFFLVNLGW